MQEKAQRILAYRAVLQTITPELRAFLGLTTYDDLSEKRAAEIVGMKSTTLRDQRDKFDAQVYAIGHAINSDTPAEANDAWKVAGIPAVASPRDPMAIILHEDIKYEDFIPTDTLNGHVRIVQADGLAEWAKGNATIDLGEELKAGRLKGARFTSLGRYYGKAFTMTVPAGSLPTGTSFSVKNTFVLEPDGFDKLIQKPGAVSMANGVASSDVVPQRMLVTSARLLEVKDGNALYELDAYCVDEHFANPETGSSYVLSSNHQGIATESVRQALRTPGTPSVRNNCIWGALAGTLSPGMCQ